MAITVSLLIFVYLMVLVSKGYLFSSSSSWLVLLFVVNVLPLLMGNSFLFFDAATTDRFDEIAVYSLVAVASFAICNFISLHIKRKGTPAQPISAQNQNLMPSRMLLAWGIYLFLFLLFLAYLSRSYPISVFFNSGSKVLIEQQENFLLLLLPTLLLGLNMMSLLSLLYAKGRKQWFIALATVVSSIAFTLLFTFGRRLLIYPLAVILILYYFKNKSKRRMSLILVTIAVTVFVIMPFMIVVRTFGLANALENYKALLQVYDLSIFASQIDFTWSFNLLVLQVQTGGVSADPLTILKPLFMLIPRSIWPDKPIALCLQILPQVGVNTDNLSVGPGFIGESLALMGKSGLVFFSSLWGVICGRYDSRIQKKYFEGNRLENIDIRLLAYLLFTVQLVIGIHRGDTGNAMVEFILTIVPLLMILKFSAYISRKRRTSSYNELQTMVRKRRIQLLFASMSCMAVAVVGAIVGLMYL